MQDTAYRFNEEIGENGKANHIHQIFEDGEWKNLCGTSTVLSVLAKPLTWWAAGLAVGVLGWIKGEDWRKLKTPALKEADMERRAKYTLPFFEKIKEMGIEDYIKLLDKGYKAHAVKLDSSADAGTDLHAELERFVKDHMAGTYTSPDDYEAKILPFIRWTEKKVKRFLWSEVHTFSKTHWLGGISDCGAELNDGSIVIIDFKSSKEAYPSQFMQIGGYDIQLTESGGYTKDGEKILTLDTPVSAYIIFPFGAEKPEPVIDTQVARRKKTFLNVLEVYKDSLLDKKD